MRLLPPLHVVLAAIVTCVATPAYAQWTRHHGSECVAGSPPRWRVRGPHGRGHE